MRKLLRLVFCCLVMSVPQKARPMLLRLAGHRIGKGVHIGICFLDIRTIDLGDGSRIGSWNVFKGIRKLSLGSNSSIGKFNLFTANDHYRKLYPEDNGVVTIGQGSAITMRHYFDVQREIRIGDRSLVAGIGTIFFTHQKGFRQLDEAKPIFLGDRIYVGAACRVMPGTHIANNIVVGAGSNISGNLVEEFSLYLSPRAVVARAIPKDSPYFTHDAPAGKA